MQNISQQELKWSGSIDIPVYESWTWQERVGDFASRCGEEPWYTTCAKDRTEAFDDTKEVIDTDNCLEHAPDPTPSEDNGSGRGNGGYTSPFNNNSFLDKAPKGKGEDRALVKKELG